MHLHLHHLLLDDAKYLFSFSAYVALREAFNARLRGVSRRFKPNSRVDFYDTHSLVEVNISIEVRPKVKPLI
jgi:hypothetical protein